MPFWSRKLPTHETQPALTPDQNRTRSRFLQLPGEIRNIIYFYALYSRLDSVFIARGNANYDFAKTVLKHGLFRVSQQVRAEALSFLCASKHLEFFEIRAANAFLEYVGAAAIGVKRMSVSQRIVHGDAMPLEDINKFFRFLEQAMSLRFFKLEVGSVLHPFELDKRFIGGDWVFLERTSEFVKGREELEFWWSAGACDPRAPGWGTFAARTRTVRELFGEGREARGLKGSMYLW